MGRKGDGCGALGALSSAHGGHAQGSVFEGWRRREVHPEGGPPSLCSMAIREKLWFWALRTPLELQEEGSFPLNFLYSNIKRGGLSAIFKTWRKLDCVCVCVSVVLPSVHHIVMAQNFIFAFFLRGLTGHTTNIPTPMQGRKVSMLFLS